MIKTALFFGAISVLSAAGGACREAPAELVGLSGVKEEIIRLVESKAIPSLSCAVVQNGEIVWEEAFGFADLEKNIPATTETQYAIASATKPLTATALMVLVERGLVDLDRPVNAYLGKTSLRAFVGSDSGATVRRILHHTSGLPMYWNFYFAGTSRRRPPLETTLERYGRLLYRPGERYHYSNLGYAIIEFLIEQISGKSYADFLAAEVFLPLKMGRTAVVASPPEGPGFAVKYSSAMTPVPFCDQDTRGAGSIYSTSHDLALFLLFHLGRRQDGQKAVLKPESIAVMRESRDHGVPDSSYALGWETGNRFGYPLITHGGVMDGCRAHLAMIPSEGLGVAILVNGENVPTIQVCDRIFAALLPKYARNLRTAFPPVRPDPPPAAFIPPAGLVGTWSGMIETHDESLPVRLVVDKEGGVRLAKPDPAGGPEKVFAPLKAPALSRGAFVIHFPQVFSLSEATAAEHRTVFGLAVSEDGLSGEASLIASDMSYSLPSFIRLTRVRPLF